MTKLYAAMHDGALLELSEILRERGGSDAVQTEIGSDALNECVTAAVLLSRLSEPEPDFAQQIFVSAVKSASRGSVSTDSAATLAAAAVLLDQLARGRSTALSSSIVVSQALPKGAVIAEATLLSAWLRAVALLWQPGIRVAWHGHWLTSSPEAHTIRDAGIDYAELNLRSDTQFSLVNPRSAIAYFPVVSGNTVELVSVRVTLRDAQTELTASSHRSAARAHGDALIHIVGLANRKQSEGARDTLVAARAMADAYGPPVQTVVEFSKSVIQTSYQLALVLADRIARGLEVPPRQGRLIATGASDQWQSGAVQTVGDAKQKCRFLAGEIRAGDRIVLPGEWVTTEPDAINALQTHPLVAAGLVSLANVDRICWP